MIVAGTVNQKMATTVRRLYDQMPEPKWVVAMGACACTGGPFREYPNVVLGVDKIVPVDVYIPGCPPRPESVQYAFMQLQEKIKAQTEERLACPTRQRLAALLERAGVEPRRSTRSPALGVVVPRRAPSDARARARGARDGGRGFDFLVDLFGIDTGEARRASSYHLRSFARDEDVFVKLGCRYDGDARQRVGQSSRPRSCPSARPPSCSG